MAIQKNFDYARLVQEGWLTLEELQGLPSEILSKISEKWQYQRFQEKKVLNSCLETLLFWRRKWS